MLETEVDQREDLYRVQDQGPFSTCLSYATSTAHKNNNNIPNPLSAEALHFTASEGDFHSGCQMPDVQKALLQRGQPEQQHCEPINEGNCDTWSPPSDVYYYTTTSTTGNPSPQLVRDLIKENRLPVLGIGITKEFHYPEAPWVFSAGDIEGRHAVVGAGLGVFDGETVVLIRNSWGSDWANSGYAWVDNSFLEENLERLLIVEESETK